MSTPLDTFIPHDPHVAVEITQYRRDAKGNFVKDGSGKRVVERVEHFDSWEDKQLFRQVTVELTTGMASETLVRVFDPKFILANRYCHPSGVLLQVVRVYMGFGLNLGEPVFKGMLTRIERNDTDTTLRFYDMGYSMRRYDKTEYHGRVKDNVELLRKLATRNELSFEGPTGYKPAHINKQLKQDGKNDWEFAKERAEAEGLVLFVRGDTLFAKEPATYGKPSLTLTLGKDFNLLRQHALSYRMPENLSGKKGVVEVRGRGRGGRRLKGKSSEHPRGTTGIDFKRDIEVHSKSYAERRAKAKKELHREHAFSCTVRAIPRPPVIRMDIRKTVELAAMGQLFSGNYIINAVRHDLTASGFSTELELYRDIGK